MKVMLLQPTLWLMDMDHLGESGERLEKSFELWLPSMLTPAGQFTTQISTKVPDEAGPPKGEKPHLPVSLPQPEHLVLRGPLKAMWTQTLFCTLLFLSRMMPSKKVCWTVGGGSCRCR